MYDSCIQEPLERDWISKITGLLQSPSPSTALVALSIHLKFEHRTFLLNDSETFLQPQFLKHAQLFTRLISRIVLLSSICISSTVFGLPLVEVNSNSRPGHAVPKCQFTKRISIIVCFQTRYPPPSPLDLIPLYFFTCAANAETLAKGASLEGQTPYGTKFKFPLSKDVTPSMKKETQTVSHVRREELVPKGRIPEDAKPDRCLNGAFVVVNYVGLEEIERSSQSEKHSPEDIDTVSDNREAIVTTFEKDGSIGTAVVLRGKIAASPPTLMVDSYCTGNTPEEAWSSMVEQRGNRALRVELDSIRDSESSRFERLSKSHAVKQK
ncbi:hypothetical protein F5880DRAFT_1502871 [Lentinula raphanica]|nr:hypothetical protein F5880DRAFT_1502871 [Lentinula raphanica]